MNCNEFRESAREILHPESAPVDSVREGLAHTLVCEDCAAYLMAERALDAQLSELAAVYSEVQAPTHVEPLLMAAYRNRLKEDRPKRVGRAFVVAHWRWLATAACAAVAAIVIFVVLHHRSAVITARSVAPYSSHATPRSASTGAAVLVSDNSSAPATDASWADGFVALPDSATGDSLEGGAILRIEMPASALASLGLPTMGVQGDQMIPADVVVGQDGTLRAIRLATD